MYVPFIPYNSVGGFIPLPKAAEMLNTKVSVVTQRCNRYRILITQKNGEPGLDRENFIQLHKHLFDERPWDQDRSRRVFH